ncbi:hypothetical protein ANO11243_072890 [Dothideomycetidae sp. 11243]|nr:hypothetical protein ANO11243_072890 [fungal sp. No.11243]
MATRRISRAAARSLFSPECRPQTLQTPSQIRTLFELPTIKSQESWPETGCVARTSLPSGEKKDVRLYSGQGYKMAWTVHQSHLLYNLNYITMSDTEAQTLYPLDLAKRYARDPAQAVLFNYASQAHNNHFYFESLTDRPRPLTEFAGLNTNLVRAFGSVDNLRDLMRYTADGIFGCGYVWLVWARRDNQQTGEWKVLATYNAGTPYVVRPDGAVDRSQRRDMNAVNPRTAGIFGNYAAGGQAARERQLGGAAEVFPVLALSVWQHSYLRDFSVHGKRAFVDAWWECIDWQKVNDRTPGAAKEDKEYKPVSL